MSLPIEAQDELEQIITSIVDRYRAKPTALIMALQDIQKYYHYLPIEALKLIAKKMNLPVAQLFGVATFFKAFSLTPKGKHHMCVCTGTACHVRQAGVIVDNLSRSLGINPGETTPDGEISFETVNCIGACALGPVITVDDEYHGHMTVAKLNKVLDDLRGKKATEETMEEVQ